jgi:hypothetical protein
LLGLLFGAAKDKLRKMFFFEKKNQKTFDTCARAHRLRRDSGAKVFCFFSSEKKAFLPYAAALEAGRPK